MTKDLELQFLTQQIQYTAQFHYDQIMQRRIARLGNGPRPGDSESAMLQSADICLEDATELLRKHEAELAAKRALKGLQYLVGIMHTDYQYAKRQIERLTK